jgi:hypothetical protein
MKGKGPVLAAMLLAVACKAGEGKGEAKGPLYVVGCNGPGKDLGTPDEQVIFNLNPNFFAAEPIEEGDRVKVNRLIIRLQPTGRSREVNDVLEFDIPDSSEVARCVRAAVVKGKPDYDASNCLQTPEGPRLRVAPDALIRGSLSPNATCVRLVVGTAVAPRHDPPDTSWDSWIELTQFGTAAQTGAPESRTPVPGDFKVDINEPLVSPRFTLKLLDDAVVNGARSAGTAVLAGILEGSFDFSLQRGQGAQTFP